MTVCDVYDRHVTSMTTDLVESADLLDQVSLVLDAEDVHDLVDLREARHHLRLEVRQVQQNPDTTRGACVGVGLESGSGAK